MNRNKLSLTGGLFLALILFGPMDSGLAADLLRVAGTVRSAQGKGVADARLVVLVDGRPVQPVGGAELTSSNRGSFAGDFLLPAGTLPTAQVAVQAAKPAWRPSEPVPLVAHAEGTDPEGRRPFSALAHITLERQITPALWLAAAILALVYLVIALEWLHRTLAALLGAALMLFVSSTLGVRDARFFIISFEEAMLGVDLNVIFLLLGMMIFVGVLKRTGLFPWLAARACGAARGNVFVLAGFLMGVTAFLSAFLDNVTTMLLMAPVSLEIARTLKIPPLSLLIPGVFAANVGGTATLIGDPPNVLIGSYAHLTFVQFLHHLTPICLAGLAAAAGLFLFRYRRDYRQARRGEFAATLPRLQAQHPITDRRLLAWALGLLGLTILVFIVFGARRMEPSVAALTGAMLLLVFSGVDIAEMLEREVAWPTLVFFMALFIIIAGAEATGFIQFLAEGVRQLSGDSLPRAVILVLWVSAGASALIDNIPFTATMLPIVAFLNQQLPGAESGVLWWALALGACLGGNGTMIGASANVVTVGLAERAGYPISFLEYLKACLPPMLLTVLLSMVYLLLWY